jgi:hypothetical protein
MIILWALPVQAKNLWNIYRENETVDLILETKANLDFKNMSAFVNILRRQLRLKREQDYKLEPMFSSAPSKEALASIYGYQPRYDLRNFYILQISSAKVMLEDYKSPFDFADRLRIDSSDWGILALESVEPDLPLSAYSAILPQSSSNCPKKKDSPIDRAWSLRNMKAPEAWKYSQIMGYPSKGSGEKIGHPDTGYSDHIDLDETALEIENENNFIDSDHPPKDPLPYKTNLTQPGHGTATGSVIISRGNVTRYPPNDEEGGTTLPGKVTGVACEAKLVPYRAIKSVARFTYGNIIKAIYKAVKDKCSVISLSLGGLSSNALKAALEYAISNNVIVVAAAGNFSWAPVIYPAKYPFCVAVAATDIDDTPWSSSAHGKEVSVSAPGKSVWRALRTKPNEGYDIVGPSCGTSYSAANVAGVAALWLAHHKRYRLINQFEPETKLQFVYKRLLQITARQPIEWDEKNYGTGIVNADQLLRKQPKDVTEQARKDYKDFKRQKRKSARENLTESSQMYYKYLTF